MYLIDTNVISEARKGSRANQGVTAFFGRAAADGAALYLSVVTIGDLRRGVELIRHRGDGPRAARLEAWLSRVLRHDVDHILPFEIDKQIAATALVHDLTVVTRNTADFAGTGAKLSNPYS
jgi:predicted nucleic acid-binding protein